jgi:uncharacterized protein YbjT (DUF2867 family)
VVRHLLDRGFRARAVARHPERVPPLFGPNEMGLEAVGANVHDEVAVAAALADAYGAVTAVRPLCCANVAPPAVCRLVE